MTIIIISMIFVFAVLFVLFLRRTGKKADRDAISPQKMVPVRFNIDNSKYGRRTAEPENISVQTKTVKTTDVPVVVEPDISPSPQIEQSKISVVECHGKNAGLVLACTIVQKCSNGSLILNTLDGPIRKKKKYVVFDD